MKTHSNQGGNDLSSGSSFDDHEEDEEFLQPCAPKVAPPLTSMTSTNDATKE